MARISLLFCFTILIAFGTILDAVSAHTKPTEPEMEEPKTVKDIEPYIYNKVMEFVTNLEKECPATKTFKIFFKKLRDYVKYVCPVASMIEKNAKDFESEMKEKAGKLFHAMVALGPGKSGSGGPMKMTLRNDQLEVIRILNSLQTVVGKIMIEHHNKKNGSITLTFYQQKAIKYAILRWEKTIIRVMKAAKTDGESSAHVSIDGGDRDSTNVVTVEMKGGATFRH